MKPIEPSLTCPGCGCAMQQFCCQHKIDGELTLDICYSCQSIWFDQYESQQMAPSGVAELFRQIHEHRDDARLPRGDLLRCPRCSERLEQRFDVSRFGKFSYHGCAKHHGRFTAFSAMLVEKGFVRQLAQGEIEALAAKVQVIRCAGCGASIDIRTQTVCPHCRSPISILDPQAVEQAMQRYVQAATPDPHAGVMALADVLLDSERAKWNDALEQAKAGNRLALGISQVDVVSSGVELIWSLLKR